MIKIIMTIDKQIHTTFFDQEIMSNFIKKYESIKKITIILSNKNQKIFKHMSIISLIVISIEWNIIKYDIIITNDNFLVIVHDLGLPSGNLIHCS